tara:strand:- start:9 stop:296 length:288 start_codon:yes stop_codon:yes gene_type:complete
MTKYFYAKDTGDAVLVREDADIADFPFLQDYPLTMTEDEARVVRNNLLYKTDWWATSDRTMTLEQTQYRQTLRDMPTHAAWPSLLKGDWPVLPAS